MTLTKNDMLRVVVAALHALPELPAKDDFRVCNRMYLRKPEVVEQYKLARAAIKSREGRAS